MPGFPDITHCQFHVRVTLTDNIPDQVVFNDSFECCLRVSLIEDV